MPVLKGYHKEVLALISKLTLKRLKNLFVLYGSHAISKWLKRNLHRGNPAYITLETTNSCNLSCPECVTGMNALERPAGWLSPELANKVFEQSAPNAIVANLYFQGEPLLNPNLFDIIKMGRQYRVYTILSTNAQNLNVEKANQLVASGLGKIVVSLDGITQESYGKYRVRGKLDLVLKGIENLKRARSAARSMFPIIEVQFIVFRFNEHEISVARKKAYALGADRFVLKTAQFYDKIRAKEWMPSSAKYARYNTNGSLNIKNKSTTGCKKMWTSLVVCAGGEVALCCMDKNALYSPGNIKDSALPQLWSSPAMDTFRQRISSGKYLSVCNNCPLKG